MSLADSGGSDSEGSGGKSRKSTIASPLRLLRRGLGAAASRVARTVVRRKRSRKGRTHPPLASMTMLAGDGVPIILEEECQSDQPSAFEAEIQASSFPLVLKMHRFLADGRAHADEATNNNYLVQQRPWHASHASHTNPTSTSSSAEEQTPHTMKLLTIGSRQWGSSNWWDSRSLLGIKIYDFAVYVDHAKLGPALAGNHQEAASSPAHLTLATQAATSHVNSTSTSNTTSSSGCGLSSDCLAQRVISRPELPVSILLRASRDLPIPLLQQELLKIISRRHIKLGGQPDDPALSALASCFTPSRLPSEARRGNTIVKGSTIAFTREEGQLMTSVGDELLAALPSAHLAAAMVDLYLGEPPVSKKAKAHADSLLQRMERDPGAMYTPTSGQQLVCHAPDDLEACVIEFK